jgi:hypothetical protein
MDALTASSFVRSSAETGYAFYNAEMPLEPFGVLTVSLIVKEGQSVESVLESGATALAVICERPAEVRSAAANVLFNGLYPSHRDAFEELLGEELDVGGLEELMTDPSLTIDGMFGDTPQLSFMTDLDDQNVIIVSLKPDGTVAYAYLE